MPVMAGWADKVPRLKRDQPLPRPAGTWTLGFLADRICSPTQRRGLPREQGEGCSGAEGIAPWKQALPLQKSCPDYVLGWHAPLA